MNPFNYPTLSSRFTNPVLYPTRPSPFHPPSANLTPHLQRQSEMQPGKGQLQLGLADIHPKASERLLQLTRVQQLGS